MTALLASDLDGTLIHHEGVYRPEGFVDPADVAAVKAWREAGNLFVPASGRSVGNVRHGLAGTGLHGDHIVCHTGAVVTDSALHPVPGLTRALDPEIVQGLCDLLIGRDGVTVLATTTDEDLVLPDGRTGLPIAHNVPVTPEALAQREVIAMPVHVPDARAAQRLADEVEERWPGRLHMSRSVGFVDAVSAGVDKGTALRSLLDGPLAGKISGPIIGVGDSWNDVPLFVAADYGVAMRQAAPEVRDAADLTCDRVCDLIEGLLYGGLDEIESRS